MSKFSKKGRHFFLTYSQCPVSREDLINFLEGVLDIEGYTIAQEKHKDGNFHLHVYVKLVKRKNIQNPRLLDYVVEDKSYHPNIQVCRNDTAVIKYVQKDTEFISTIKKGLYTRLIEKAKENKLQEAMDLLVDEKPAEFVRYGKYIKENLQTLVEEVSEEEKFEFYQPPDIQFWDPTRASLWLVGKTGVGKTEYAKTLFTRPLLVSHMDQLKDLKPKHDGIIFDDMSFCHWPREATIHITDINNKRGINVKHGCIVIPKGLPRVFTSNKWIWPADETGAIARRICRVKVNFDLRKSLVPEDLCPLHPSVTITREEFSRQCDIASKKIDEFAPQVKLVQYCPTCKMSFMEKCHCM